MNYNIHFGREQLSMLLS